MGWQSRAESKGTERGSELAHRVRGSEGDGITSISSRAEGKKWTVFTRECEWRVFIRGRGSKSTRQYRPSEVSSEGRMFRVEAIDQPCP